jgi:hypothetical protein
VRWQGACGAFGEALWNHIEAAVEARSEVLPGDGARQLHEPFFAELPAQRLDELLARVGRGPGQGRGVVERQPLQRVEEVAGLVLRNRQDLLVRQSIVSADRRTDVQSEDAADHRGGLE